MPGITHHQSLVETGWQTPTDFLNADGKIHVWRVPLRVHSGRLEELNGRLTEGEKLRFRQYRFAADREAHTVARGRLRELLGHYLSIAPEDLVLENAPQGKPFLPDYPDFGFNVSHAGDWAVIAFAPGLEIGVDTEETDRSFRVESLVGRFFSRREIPVILGLPEAGRHQAFYLAWTRKEAIIKARGDGLQLPLSEFGVSIVEGEPVRMLHTDWEEAEYLRWQLRSFMVAEDYPGAVAWLGEERIIRFFQ